MCTSASTSSSVLVHPLIAGCSRIYHHVMPFRYNNVPLHRTIIGGIALNQNMVIYRARHTDNSVVDVNWMTDESQDPFW